jgi:hypothetical protein
VSRVPGVTPSHPLGTADVVLRALTSGVTTFLGISTLATGDCPAVRGLLDRHRLRRRITDWAVVEPVWSRKVP